MFGRYPNKITITWQSSILNEATGSYENGVLNTIIIDGRLESASPNQQVSNGTKLITVSYKLYTSDNCTSVPIGASCDFNGTKRQVLKVDNKQAYTEIWL